ncbi:MAG: alpha/beta hydrolase fold domain-containing protein, partial [Lachnospiraceae bacterium]|nr:alpha/beta hydrolase fold domain-containing protein [Lachnospiraceae bacterium]
FPPTLMITAGQDDLCNEAEEFALRLSRNSNEVTLKRFEGVGHAFSIYRREGYEAAYELMFRFRRRGLDLNEK